MRIDLVLKYLCIAKSRSFVKNMCDRGAVEIDGKPVKSSATVRDGDKVTLHYPKKTVTIEIVTVPAKPQSKAKAPEFYREIG